MTMIPMMPMTLTMPVMRAMARTMKILLILALLCASAAPAASTQGRELRVFISADMEGITGVVNAAQLSPGEFEYERFRKAMTAEVNAAIDSALSAGATNSTRTGMAPSISAARAIPRKACPRHWRSWPALRRTTGITERRASA